MVLTVADNVSGLATGQSMRCTLEPGGVRCDNGQFYQAPSPSEPNLSSADIARVMRQMQMEEIGQRKCGPKPIHIGGWLSCNSGETEEACQQRAACWGREVGEIRFDKRGVPILPAEPLRR